MYVSKEVNISVLSEKDREAAQNEVDVLVKVPKHPNIIQYIEHYEQNGILYIIMEYADGGDLLQKIQLQKKDPGGARFSEDQIMTWFIQMALAVKHMHENKILHRDLKSANIFLTKENAVKIGDFGFGKIMANTIAQAKTLCGTPYYFSPELCTGRPYNNKSDIWALGCILAEMCCLGHAYDAKNIKELVKRVTKGTYQPIPSCYSSDLHRLIEIMLTKDQAARPNIKSVLTLDYVQLRLGSFAQVHGELYNAEQLSTTTPRPSSGADSNSPSEASRRKLPAKEAKRPLRTGNFGEEDPMPPSRGDSGMALAHGSRQQLREFLRGPPPTDASPGHSPAHRIVPGQHHQEDRHGSPPPSGPPPAWMEPTAVVLNHHQPYPVQQPRPGQKVPIWLDSGEGGDGAHP
eukprot:RCo037704